LFIGELEYGYLVPRGSLAAAKELQEENAGDRQQYWVEADRSWQTTRVEVRAGDRLKISALGKFQIADIDRPWPCEAGGITIEYYRGQPLGMLMAGILGHENRVEHLLTPMVAGLEAEIDVKSAGRLCLRVNESPARLDDNQGGLQVSITRLAK
jgi:hypothetical protein